MIRISKETDERREAGPLECWCLHGSVGSAADWRGFSQELATSGISTRAVDLWRFLESGPLDLSGFGAALNGDAASRIYRGTGRSLAGYSLGGRLALHALLEKNHPWQAAVIISANPGLEDPVERTARRVADASWASRAMVGDWRKFLDDWDAQPLLAGGIGRDPHMAYALKLRRQEIARSFVDWSLGAQEPLWDRLAEISVPVLWVVGENDAKYRALGERAAALIPRSRLAVVPGAGHRVLGEPSGELATTVAHFLRTGS